MEQQILLVACLSVLLLTTLVTFKFLIPWRGWIVRTRPSVERFSEAAELGTAAAVLLIHGTFARNAPWTKEGHQFASEVASAFGACSISSLKWSGDNSLTQRQLAKEVAKEWICSQSANQVYLIGHSHGGNIAVDAANELSDRPVTVVTLSTPFIIMKARYPGFIVRTDIRGLRPEEIMRQTWGRDGGALALGFFLYTLAGSLLALNWWVDDEIQIIHYTIAGLCSLVLALVILSIMTAFLKRSMYLEKLCRVDLPPNRLVILRTAGDEASGLLAVGQFTAWVVRTTFRTFGRMMRYVAHVEEIVGNYSIYLYFLWLISIILWLASGYVDQVAPALKAAVPVLVVLFLLHGKWVTVSIDPFLVTLAAAVAFPLYLPFGLGLAASSVVLDLSVEAAPLGCWTVTTVVGGEDSTPHSHLYDSKVVGRLIKEQLCRHSCTMF